ncbi:prolyl oligopeptidase family serine peptidase [Pusillimonas sp.]|uniref:prolyl oligopeptidase family serine peptidase n=1 Tax=Pusillimonas sp. TaxID=3040095 RepID=UPI0029ACDAB8|nr:prolyl oligopeptidase family serine peptidase [Pusillimonas sp.]MDX3895704.1 prolyl oligopeptidase family serine peptidase [Pusillimonas sp.]
MVGCRFTLALTALLALAGCDGGSGKHSEPPTPELAYPETAAGSDSDTYFSRAVADPYRWLEDIRSQKTDNWVQAQNRFTADYIKALPDYDAIARRIAPWFAAPRKAAAMQSLNVQQEESTRRVQGVQGVDGHFYYQLQVQQERNHKRIPAASARFVSVDNVIYVASGPDAVDQSKVLVNVDDFRTDPDDDIRLVNHQVSPDGKYMVYAMERNFADLVELHVVDLMEPTRPLLRIPHVFSSEFTLYGDGVVYSSPSGTEDPHVSPHTFQSLYYQPFAGGERQVWFRGQEFDQIAGTALHQGQLYITVFSDMQIGQLRLDPARPERGAHVFLDARADQQSFNFQGASAEDPAKLLFITTQGAASNRLIEVDPADPSPGNWREILPRSTAGETVYVNEIMVCGSDYYAEHLDHGSSRLFHYSAAGAREIPLPGMGAVSGMYCSELDGRDILNYRFSSLAQPRIDFSYDPATNVATQGPARRYEGYDPSLYEMRRLVATGADGAQVPVYIAHKKGFEASGEAPTLIYVYGGFGVALTPGFQEKAIPLLENGGIYAVAQVRGGNEFGSAWHDAGRLLNKQNTYDDVIAVAQHLIDQGLTRPGKLALQGESNGGLTTAAVALQRPDLFSVVFPTVGVLDLVRYDKFTSGFGWHGDYGQTTDQAQFENMMQFSPLHNVKPLAYPPTYVFTGKSDGRVMPAHSYKFAAALQNTATGTNPYLLYAFPKDGHSLNRNWQTVLTYLWTAFFYHTGTPYAGPGN